MPSFPEWVASNDFEMMRRIDLRLDRGYVNVRSIVILRCAPGARNHVQCTTGQGHVRIYKFPAHLVMDPVSRNSPRLEVACLSSRESFQSVGVFLSWVRRDGIGVPGIQVLPSKPYSHSDQAKVDRDIKKKKAYAAVLEEKASAPEGTLSAGWDLHVKGTIIPIDSTNLIYCLLKALLIME